MIRFLIALAMVFAVAGTAVAQTTQQPQAARTYTQAELWRRSGDRISFVLAGISVPTQIGALRLTRSVEASREGQGLDNALLYASADEQVFATVYIYAPALADASLTAFMTDNAIHLQSGSELRTLSSGIVAAGGRDGVAFRADYAGFRQNRLASSAAFMRVGRWIVKLRVSGPEPRRAEVEAAMNALLREMSFEGRPGPAAFTPIALPTCRRSPDRPARMSPADDAETAAEALIANAGVDLPGSAVDLSARGWCRSAGYRVANAAGTTPVFRILDPPASDLPRRRVLVALLADNGTMFEVMERRFDNRTSYVLIHHQIGRTLVLGSYDSPPTDEQLRAIDSGEDGDGGRARAVITYHANGDSNIVIQAAPSPAPAPPTT
jgi:hypothetical protein